MPQLFTYLIEVSICLFVFYGLYHLAFKNMVTFQYNRIYFMGAYLMSFIIPYFAFDVFPIYIDAISQNDALYISPETQLEVATGGGLDFIEILFYIYLSTAAIFLGRLLKGIWVIVTQIKSSQKHYNSEFTIVVNSLNDQTFTFFNFLFQPESKKIDNEVAAHEMIHIKQWHTLDVIISELVKVVLWFNPIAYFMQTQIKLNHEFICDSFAASLSTPYKYAQYLSESISNNNNLILTSNFAYKLKNRIIMLEKSVNNFSQKWRYLSLLPLIAGLVFFFSCEGYVVEKEQPITPLKMTIVDTITTFDYDTYEEQVEIVKREVDAVEVIDTIVTFNSDTYEEQIQVVKTLVPIEHKKGTKEYDVWMSQKQKNTIIIKGTDSKENYGVDTVSTLDYDSGEWTQKVVANTNACYGFYWGTRFNNIDQMTVEDAIANLTSKIQILKLRKDEACEPVKKISGRITFKDSSDKLEPITFAFNNMESKIGINDDVKKRITKGSKIYIDNLKVNGKIKLKGKIITID